MSKAVNSAKRQAAKQTAKDPPRVALDLHDDSTLNVVFGGDFEALLSVSGGADVVEPLVSQLVDLGSNGNRLDERAANFALGFVDAMTPGDAAETLLLAQMAATHQATLMLARRLNHVKDIPQQDAAERALNKTARTFAAQMDTLKRYRSKGQQTVRVERVTVQDGGQAIVGNVEPRGRGGDKK